MIKEAYVSFEVAKLLKEKGFDEYGMYFYTLKDEGREGYKSNRTLGEFARNSDPNLKDRAVSCPTHQMAMKWLREKYNIYISIQPDFPSDKDYKMYWCWSANILCENCISMKGYQCYIETYEEACEAAIKYSLENLI